MPTLTFTYTVQISDDEADQLRSDQDVADDGTVTPVTYGYGLLGVIVSRHGLPAVYRNHDTGKHETTRGHMSGVGYPRLAASIVLGDDDMPRVTVNITVHSSDGLESDDTEYSTVASARAALDTWAGRERYALLTDGRSGGESVGRVMEEVEINPDTGIAGGWECVGHWSIKSEGQEHG